MAKGRPLTVVKHLPVRHQGPRPLDEAIRRGRHRRRRADRRSGAHPAGVCRGRDAGLGGATGLPADRLPCHRPLGGRRRHERRRPKLISPSSSAARSVSRYPRIRLGRGLERGLLRPRLVAFRVSGLVALGIGRLAAHVAVGFRAPAAAVGLARGLRAAFLAGIGPGILALRGPGLAALAFRGMALVACRTGGPALAAAAT